MGKTLISFFSGALGLDLGLDKAGFTTRAIVECDQNAVAGIRENHKHLLGKRLILIDRPIFKNNAAAICRDILTRTRLKRGSLDILAGAPPCQPFSTAGRRLSVQDDRGEGLEVFLKAAYAFYPKHFVIENVRGLLSAALKHRPLAQRGPGFPSLSKEEQYGSAFKVLLQKLQYFASRNGYCVTWGVLNASSFGCPQSRERLIIIGSRNGHSIWPKATHGKTPDLLPLVTLKEGLASLVDPNPSYEKFTAKVLGWMQQIAEGQNWKMLPATSQRAALGGAYDSWGGRSGFLRRLSWDKPCPTITVRPNGKATMLCHPTENRPLSIRECARIQQFPDHWTFSGARRDQYTQIGNATPVGLATAIGQAIKAHSSKRGIGQFKGRVLCADDSLTRIMKRPKTILNPPRMRKIQCIEEGRLWLNGSAGNREGFSRFHSLSGPEPSVRMLTGGATRPPASATAMIQGAAA